MEGNISVTDKATINVTADDVALCVDGNLAISGGNVEAKSENSNGIYAGGALKISDGATVNSTGYKQALMSGGALSITDSQVETTSTGDAGIFSRGDVSIQNSTVKASEAENYYAITAKGTTTVTGSWVETNYEDSVNGGITDSVLFNGNSGTVIGNATLLGNTTLDAGKTLLIPGGGTSLTVGEGKTFTNRGTVTVEGGFSTEGGALVCNSHSGGTATCTAQALCDVCQTPYGDLDPANHTALTHVEAKAATTEAEGNIEYWYCEGCSKYYSDATAATEITKEQIVTAKLKPQETATPTPAPTEQPAATAAPAATVQATATPQPTAAPTPAPTPKAVPTIPQTGDNSSVTLLFALLLLSGGAYLGMAASKKAKQ